MTIGRVGLTALGTTRFLLSAAILSAGLARPVAAQVSQELVRSYLWPASDEELTRAAGLLEDEAPSLSGLDRQAMSRLEGWMRAGPELEAAAGVGDMVHRLLVAAPGRREVPTLVRLPSVYTPDRRWPLMLALHGGPPASVEDALGGAVDMLQLWAGPAEAAGWIVASPAMVDVVFHDGQTQERVPYEIFQPEEARAVIDAVRAHFSVDPDRIVSTGISLGAGFSIAHAAARPDWFSAIVPVSTEGESREWLLRNLAPVPTYVLNGAQDRNIRGVGGPRALDAIMTRLGYDLVFHEFADRAHESFQEHYPGVLDWLEERPRETTPPEVLRVPHAGIVPTSRRVHWIEADTRQALLRARVTGPGEIDVTVRWARSVTVLLNDELVDLDGPVTIRVNDQVVFSGRVERSAQVALEEAKRWNDEGRTYAARLRLPVPNTPASIAVATKLAEKLEPRHPEGTLSFWETHAVRSLEERFPTLGFDAVEAALPADIPAAPEQVALRVTDVEPDGAATAAGLRAGDVLVSFGHEIFFADRGGAAGLYHWLLRELRSTPATYQLSVFREGRLLSLKAQYQLGPYRPPGA